MLHLNCIIREIIFRPSMNCPLLVAKNNTPKIIWYQTDAHVFLRILLCDVENYFLEVRSDCCFFSTIIDTKEYQICLYLFGTVLPKRTMHTNLGREIKVILEKSFKWLDWLRLQDSKGKNSLIVYDSSQIQEKKYEIKQCRLSKDYESFSEYKRLHYYDQILPDIPSDESYDSEDEKMDDIITQYS